MRTALHSKALKKGIYRKASPMEVLMARQTMSANLAKHGQECLSAAHGSEQRELIASLAYLLGISAEVARSIPVAGHNRPGLHQALEVLVEMACEGCRWNADWAAQLATAAEVSVDLFCDYRQLANRSEPAARALAQDIRKGTVRQDAIAPLDLPAADLPSGKEGTAVPVKVPEISRSGMSAEVLN